MEEDGEVLAAAGWCGDAAGVVAGYLTDASGGVRHKGIDRPTDVDYPAVKRDEAQ